MNELVVLVNNANHVLGSANKATVHTGNTLLHRGVSLFLFNDNGELLLQQRAKTKITWPGVWSNSVCGHPSLGESAKHTARRRLQYELGIQIPLNSIEIVLPNYKYRYSFNGIFEHELCPVMVARYNGKPTPNPKEVAAIQWVDWQKFVDQMSKPNDFSQWCAEETQLLAKSKKFRQFYSFN